MSGVEEVREVLEAHATSLGPVTGCWICECGATSTNGHISTGDLTTREERRREWRTHVAGLIAPLLQQAREEGAREALEPVRALADEWAEEGPSLVRNAYSGGDVHEGQTIELCATLLRAAIGADE